MEYFVKQSIFSALLKVLLKVINFNTLILLLHFLMFVSGKQLINNWVSILKLIIINHRILQLICLLRLYHVCFSTIYKQNYSSLAEPHSGFRIAFNMFDTDGNQIVDKREFLVVSIFCNCYNLSVKTLESPSDFSHHIMFIIVCSVLIITLSTLYLEQL